MKKEKVTLPSDVDEISDTLCYGERHPEWEWIKEEIVYSDLEKGYHDKEVVLKRKSDNKYFKFEFSDSNNFSLDESGSGNDWPLVGKEVFPKQKTIITYE